MAMRRPPDETAPPESEPSVRADLLFAGRRRPRLRVRRLLVLAAVLLLLAGGGLSVAGYTTLAVAVPLAGAAVVVAAAAVYDFRRFVARESRAERRRDGDLD